MQRQAGDRLTPLEVAELAGKRLPAKSAAWLGRITALTGLGRAEPAGFERHVIQPMVEIYGDPRFPSRDKSLVIGFTGQLNRLMMPLAAVLQALPAERCDLVVVRKGRQDHYDHGIPPWTGMTEAVGGLLREADAGRYRRLATFGVSAGGLPALRYGILGGAERAVSVGGRFHWHIHRLRTGGEVPAFDALCACMVSRSPELVCVYSADHPEDAANARRLAAIGPVRLMPVDGVSQHNCIEPMLRAGRLPTFLEEVLGL